MTLKPVINCTWLLTQECRFSQKEANLRLMTKLSLANGNDKIPDKASHLHCLIGAFVVGKLDSISSPMGNNRSPENNHSTYKNVVLQNQVFNDHLGSSNDPCYIQNCVIMNLL